MDALAIWFECEKLKDWVAEDWGSRLKTAVFGAGPLRDKSTGKLRAPIHPHSAFYKGWETLSGVLLLYTTAVTPLLIAFFSEQEGYCNHPPTIRVDLFVDLFFLLEIVINFITGKVVVGEFISGLREVAAIYLRNGFPVDVLSACPIAWMEFLLVPDETCEEAAERNGDNDFIRYLRLVRMLRLLRMLKVLKIFNVLRDLFRMRPTVIRMLKLAFSVCMIAHVGGCAWWFIKLQGHEDDMMAFKQRHSIDTPVWSAYLVSVYFQMATLCTVGYGDISADTDGERLLMTFVMLLGASVFAIIISNISALVASMQSAESLYVEKMDEVVSFLRLYDVPSDLESRVQSFYEFKSRQDTYLSTQKNILSPLPKKLQTEIKMALMNPLLSSVWLFDSVGSEYSFRRSVVPKLQPDLILPGERLYSSGGSADFIYIIISGSVQTLLPVPDGVQTPGHVLEKHGKGEVVGTMEVLLECRRCTDCRAVGYVELYRLHRDDWIQLAVQFPSLRVRMFNVVARAEARLAGIARLDATTKEWVFNELIATEHKWVYLANRAYLKREADWSQADFRDACIQRIIRYAMVKYDSTLMENLSFGEALLLMHDQGEETAGIDAGLEARAESSHSGGQGRLSSSSSQDPAPPDAMPGDEIEQSLFMLDSLQHGVIDLFRMLKGSSNDTKSKSTTSSPVKLRDNTRANVDDTVQKLITDAVVNAKLLCRVEARMASLSTQWSAITTKLAERPRRAESVPRDKELSEPAPVAEFTSTGGRPPELSLFKQVNGSLVGTVGSAQNAISQNSDMQSASTDSFGAVGELSLPSKRSILPAPEPDDALKYIVKGVGALNSNVKVLRDWEQATQNRYSTSFKGPEPQTFEI